MFCEMVRMDGTSILRAVLCTFLAALQATHGIRYHRFCYVTNWARFRAPPLAFRPENVKEGQCSHVAYAFATLDRTGTKLIPTERGDDPAMYRRFNSLKKRDPGLRTLLSVGGWEMPSTSFSRLVSTEKKMLKFADNVIRLLRSRGFDGLDLDWEFPGSRGSPPGDKKKFTKLIQILREAFEKDAGRRRRRRLLLTAALGPSTYQVQTSYEPVIIARSLDLLNLMTYDMHGVWDTRRRTAHHAALYSSPTDRVHNIDFVTKYWTGLGIPRHKLLIGLPFYSRTFTAPGNPSTFTGPGAPGEYTNTRGYLAYFEICPLIQRGKGQLIRSQRVPYMVNNDQWMGYDDERSIREKVEYVTNKNLGGIMVWALDLDDFHGVCGKKFPLMNAVLDGFTAANRRRFFYRH